MTKGRVVLPLALLGLATTPVVAQQSDDGGLVFSFGVEQEFRNQTNPGLDTPPAASESQARTHLSFGILAQTPAERFSLDAKGVLEAGQGHETGLSTPQVELAYRRESAAAALDMTGFLRERAVDTLDFYSTDDALGDPVVTTVSGEGTRRQSGMTARFEAGRDAPLGATFSFGVTKTDYLDTTDPALLDSLRHTGRLALRADLSPVTTLTAGLSASRLKEVDADSSHTEELSLGVSNARPNGRLDLETSFTRTDSGSRQSLTFGRAFDLPTGDLTVRIGASSRVSNGSDVIGGLDWSQRLPLGRISVTLDRRVAGDEQDEEALISRLGLSLYRDLTPRLSSNLSLGLQDSQKTAAGTSTQTADISASLHYGLSEDLLLNFGASHRSRDESGVGRANSNTVFLSLSKSFQYRP